MPTIPFLKAHLVSLSSGLAGDILKETSLGPFNTREKKVQERTARNGQIRLPS